MCTIIVVVGPTGSGKSCLVNALIGSQVAATGVGGITTSVTSWVFPRAPGDDRPRVVFDTAGSDFFMTEGDLVSVMQPSQLVVIAIDGHPGSARTPLVVARQLRKPVVFVRTGVDRCGSPERIAQLRSDDLDYLSITLQVANPELFYVSTRDTTAFDWTALCARIDQF